VEIFLCRAEKAGVMASEGHFHFKLHSVLILNTISTLRDQRCPIQFVIKIFGEFKPFPDEVYELKTYITSCL
jgi:hypothetical protein